MSEPSFLSGPRLIRDALIEKIRTLPLGGQVTAEVGQEVGPEVVVALLNPEGFLHFVNVPRELDVSPGVAGACLLKAEGDPVGRGEVIAARPAALGLLVEECRSPTDGFVQRIYPSGHLTIRARPIPVEAFVGGRVIRTVPGAEVVILTAGTLILGVFGQGGEAHGPLVVLEQGRTRLPADSKGAVVVTPTRARPDLIQACRDAEVSALVAPSLHLADLPAEVRLTLVLTEGFGDVAMNASFLETLLSLAGREASVSGLTQLRAGVERPEIIIPQRRPPARPPSGASLVRLGRRTRVWLRPGTSLPRLTQGVRVRLTRAPRFGLEGVVTELPAAPQRIATGSVLPVVRVRLDDGTEVTVPLRNIETLELAVTGAGGDG